MKTLSLTWSKAQGQWLGRYKKLDGNWSAKRVPKRFRRGQRHDAERWLHTWYATYVSEAGVAPENEAVNPSQRVTLIHINERWLAYRDGDPGTDPTYARSLRSQWTNHIEGHELANLDITSELSPLHIKSWMRQLPGAPASRLATASTLSVMLDDAILHGDQWGIDPRTTHPMLSPHIRKELAQLRSQRRQESVKPRLSAGEVETLLTHRTSKLQDVRRVKYSVRLATGLREREAQGLTWADIVDLPIPHLWVRRQLVQGGPLPYQWLDDVVADHGPNVDLTKLGNAVVKPPKEGSRRPIPLVPIVVATLAWWRQIGWRHYVGRDPRAEDPIFPSGRQNRHQPRGQFCRASAGHLILRDLERVGLPTNYTSPANGLIANHDSRSLRRTFASLLDDVGVDEAKIGALLGHASGSVTASHYIDRVLKGRLDVVSQLPMPDRVVMRAHVIRDPSRGQEELGEVVRLKKTARRS